MKVGQDSFSFAMKDRIRQLMEAQHMNQQAFARFTNIGSASLSSIFTGRTRPTMNHVMAIMEAFPDVNPKWLIQGAGPMMNNGADEMEYTPQNFQGAQSPQNPQGSLSSQTHQNTLGDHQSYNKEQNASSGQAMLNGTGSTPAQATQGSLFSENSFSEEQPIAQPRQQRYNPTAQSQQRGHSNRFSTTDNMAVGKNYSPTKVVRESEGAGQYATVNVKPSCAGHITEIRVFFDDQTWESFVPKK